ncbi:MAG: hypothetical protein LBL90_07145 [Prevotellaceae bacterium]|jgi:hypothetical protein|nr:hypothetical protein [Prevotellaceae bacterium]
MENITIQLVDAKTRVCFASRTFSSANPNQQMHKGDSMETTIYILVLSILPNISIVISDKEKLFYRKPINN